MGFSPDAAGRSDLDLACRQLEGIEHWHRARRTAVEAVERGATSREGRMDLSRRLEVLDAQHRALVARTEQQLQGSVEVLRGSVPCRAVVVHRNEWFADRLCTELLACDVDVVARLVNGAEAVGASVAEQPDLLLVEDTLPMLGGEDVVREVRRYCPGTQVAAQVEHEGRVAALLQAGAHTAFPRRSQPAEVAQLLVVLLRDAGLLA